MKKKSYVDEFERWTTGPAERRTTVRAELEEHLLEAEGAGELESALDRLGTPRDAARAFATGYQLRPAPLLRRAVAALVDIAVTAAIFLAGLLVFSQGGSGDSVVRIVSYETRAEISAVGFLIGLSAFAWWVVGLTLCEWRYQRTPGKALMGLRVTSDDGLAPSFWQVVVRRLTLVFSGPLQIIDWVFALFDKRRQRAIEKLARTIVVYDGGSLLPSAVPANGTV
ncbi:MAG: RDD family protein [Actinomycetota bacterium]